MYIYEYMYMNILYFKTFIFTCPRMAGTLPEDRAGGNNPGGEAHRPHKTATADGQRDQKRTQAESEQRGTHPGREHPRRAGATGPPRTHINAHAHTLFLCVTDASNSFFASPTLWNLLRSLKIPGGAICGIEKHPLISPISNGGSS